MEKTKILEKAFTVLLMFIPLSLFAEYMHSSPIVIFILASLAILPLAKYIGESTEEISAYTGPALGGLLNATFGNATELIISFFALQAGLTEMVKASITGSIIGNLLLILGMALFFGGLGKDTNRHSIRQQQGQVLPLCFLQLPLLSCRLFSF